MLKSISWSQFVETISIATVIYYSGILGIFYRTEVLAFFSHNMKSLASPSISPDNGARQEEFLFEMASRAKEVINTTIKEASTSKWIKEELLHSLHRELKTFSELKATAFAPAIYHHIIHQSASAYGLQISEDDLVGLL